jgi:serine/threonine-protein kinase
MRASGERVSNVLGKYRLIAELGHGGMADVYLAVAHGPAGFNKLMVVKQIRPQFADDPEFLSMFLDEARLAARLSHPNVVQTNEVGEDQGRYFMAMEYLEGQPLNRVIHRVSKVEGQLPLGMYLRILVDVLAGLHHAHELCDYDETPLEVVHRDVTPHNVFVTYDGMVKIVDFGIAKALSSSAETRAGVLKGKVAYMAPEQMRGERVDRRADVYSVGVMLWEAATGRRLWKGKPDVAILQEVMSGRAPSPSSVNPSVPPRLEAICNRALSPNREDRYATAAELATDIEALLEDRNERVTLRDVGKLVSGVFYQDRARMRAIVEEQLKSAQHLVTDEWRAVNIPRIPDPPTVSSDPSRGLEAARISGTPPPVSGSDPRSISGMSEGTPVTGPTHSSSLVVTGLASQSGAEPRRRLRLFAVSGTVALATAALGVWLIARSSNSSEEPAAVASPVESAAVAPGTPPPTATPVAEVSVTIQATPADARLTLDGHPLAKNPFRAELARDDNEHELRVEAEGYEPVVKTVRLDKDVALTVTLARVATAPAPRGAAGAKRGPAAAPAPRNDPTPDMQPKPRGRRPLSADDNPYLK